MRLDLTPAPRLPGRTAGAGQELAGRAPPTTGLLRGRRADRTDGAGAQPFWAAPPADRAAAGVSADRGFRYRPLW